MEAHWNECATAMAAAAAAVVVVVVGGGFIFNKKERKALEWGVLPAAPIIPHIWGRRITPVAAKATAKAIGCADRRGNPRLARTDMPIIDWEKIFAGYNAKTNQGCG